MKKIALLLLCFTLLTLCPVTAFATETEDEVTNTVISLTVPANHNITVVSEHAKVFYNGVSREKFMVERLSEPRILIRAESGNIIKSVTVNDEDMTNQIRGGYIKLPAVCEDMIVTVTTEKETATSTKTFTVKGTVTLNEKPFPNVDLELRSILKTAITDENGKFAFYEVEQGEHSLTAIKDGKIIGYLHFLLTNDIDSTVVLNNDSTYNISADQNGAGIDLDLVLNEENGLLSIEDITTIELEQESTPQTEDNFNIHWWWLLLFISAVSIAILKIKRSN